MRDRTLTPYFPAPWGDEPTKRGKVSSPGRKIPGRSMVGRVVENGRYLLLEKTGHSPTCVRYTAHDMIAAIPVDLELHPDHQEEQGFRVGSCHDDLTRTHLPDLYRMDFSEDLDRHLPSSIPRDSEPPADRLSKRVWRAISSVFK